MNDAIRVGDFIVPRSDVNRRLRTTHPCSECGEPRYFSDRLKDDGLCNPCRRNHRQATEGSK